MTSAFRFTRPEKLGLEFNPKLSVAIVIACRGGQEKLDLVLAALSVQSYPSRLTTTYVIDDGSEIAITLPKLRPAKTELIKYKNSRDHWGKTAATNDVVSKLKQDVLWFIDADMIFEPDHLTHHMKWHHDSDDYVVLGWKRFVDTWSYSPQDLHKALTSNNFHKLHSQSWGKELWESRIKHTNELINPGLDGYRSLVGATFSILNKQWKYLGGYDRDMKTGEDTELGWRVFNSGLRMVPERNAHSWHLGHSSIELDKVVIQNHNDPTFAQRIPDRRSIRATYSFQYSVVTYDLIIDVRSASLKNILLILDKLTHLEGTTYKARLLAPWHLLEERYRITEDQYADLREIKNWLMGDSRFEFVEVEHDSHLTIDNLITRFTSSSTPYHLFIEGDFNADLNDLVHYLVTEELGFVGVADSSDRRAFAIYAPALARAHRHGGWIYKQISNQWGVRWLTHEKFSALYLDKHNRTKRLFRFIKREFRKIRSLTDLKFFIKKIAKILLRKIMPRG
jgi:GT2 family glycosyltransferase